MAFSCRGMVRLANEPVANSTILGRMYDCHRNTATMVCNLMSCVYLEAQAKLMNLTVSLLNNTRQQYFALHKVKWDETSEKLAYGAGIMCTKQQCISSWHVLVARHQFMWGFCRDDDNTCIHVFDVVTPPLPLLTTSAQHIYSSLQEHPLVQPIRAFRGDVMASHTAMGLKYNPCNRDYWSHCRQRYDELSREQVEVGLVSLS